MRVLLDECIPLRLKTYLTTLGYEVTHLTDLHLSGLTNGEVYEKAKQGFDIFVTNDRHFRSQTIFPPAKGLGILLLRITPNVTSHFISALEKFFVSESFENVVGKKVVVRKDGWSYVDE